MIFKDDWKKTLTPKFLCLIYLVKQFTYSIYMNVYSLHSIYICIPLKLFYGRRGNTDTTDLLYTTRSKSLFLNNMGGVCWNYFYQKYRRVQDLHQAFGSIGNYKYYEICLKILPRDKILLFFDRLKLYTFCDYCNREDVNHSTIEIAHTYAVLVKLANDFKFLSFLEAKFKSSQYVTWTMGPVDYFKRETWIKSFFVVWNWWIPF